MSTTVSTTNQQQVKYFHAQTRDTSKIGRDAITNLHELAYMTDSFVWSIATYPDLVLCCGLENLSKLLVSRSDCFLSYDTTFCLGDFYLSFIVTQCEYFTQKPIMPVAFVLHERKFDRVHEVFFQNVRDKIPSLKQCCIVTDGESAIIKAVSSVMPEWKLVTCWNHIITDVEFWLKKHGASADEIAVYKNQMYELLRCETCVFLSSKIDSFTTTWSEAFVTYLYKRISMAFVGYLRQCGISDSSVTTNTSESMNAMLKRFQV